MNSAILYITGAVCIGMAIFHLNFSKIFAWKTQLDKLSRVNRSIMIVMNYCLILLFILMAMFALYYQNELLDTTLGNAILLCFSLFWAARFLMQFIYFSVKHPLSILLALVFLILALGFLLPVLI